MGSSQRTILDIGPSEPVSLSAAVVALFVLRASLSPDGEAPAPDIFKLDAEEPPSTLWAVARRLAELPKPVFYAGAVEDGAIVCRPLGAAESTPTERALFEWRQQHKDPGLLNFVDSRYANPPEVRVALWGGGELLRVSLSAIREWQRSYSLLGPWAAGADFSDSDYPRSQGARREDLGDCVAFVSVGAS